MMDFSTRLRFLPAAIRTNSRPNVSTAVPTMVFGAMLLCAFGSRGQAQVPVGAVLASAQRGVMTTPTNVNGAPLVNATVVLHAAANAGPPGTGPVGRLMGGPPALATTIPTDFKPPFTTRDGVIPFRIIRREKPARLAYTPIPKVINPLVGPPLPMSTGTVTSTAANGANAQAKAEATFQMGAPNKRGTPTYSKTDSSSAKLNLAPRGVNPRTASPWTAGALVLDPLTFSAHNGDFIDTDLTLNPGMSVNPQTPDEVDGFLFEGGANVPGLSPGSVGTDDNGDPLFYSLSITFDQQDSSPMVNLMTDRTMGNFYDPGTSTLLSDQDIINAVMSSFTPNIGGGWTVNTARPLFEYIGNPLTGLPDEGMLINLDMNAAVGAEAVPEPGSIALLTGFGVVGSLFAMRRLRRERGVALKRSRDSVARQSILPVLSRLQ